MPGEAVGRLPGPGQVVLDHVGHFVADVTAARDALAAAGFTVTPVARHAAPDDVGVTRPAGTGNVCVMLDHGYLEILFQTGEDTAVARHLAAALDRHAGVHLAAFASADATAEAARLDRAGFAPQAPVALRRPIEGQEAAFSVIRLPPGAMPEGRIQFLSHLTEDVVWQLRWLGHGNGAHALCDLVVVTGDDSAPERWGRFLGRPVRPVTGGWRVDSDRSGILLLTPDAAAGLLGPGLPPGLAAYGLLVRSLDRAEEALRRGAVQTTRQGRCLLARFPAALGLGMWAFAEQPKDLPWSF